MNRRFFKKFIIKSLCVLSSISIFSCNGMKVSNSRAYRYQNIHKPKNRGVENYKFRNRRLRRRRGVNPKSLRRRKLLKRNIGIVGTMTAAAIVGGTVWYNCCSKNSKQNLDKNFPEKLNKNSQKKSEDKYITVEGYDYRFESQGNTLRCAYCSLANLLKFHGIELKTQELFDIINIERPTLSQCAKPIANYFAQKNIELYFHHIGFRLVNIYATGIDNNVRLKNLILKFYQLNNKQPFGIGDSHYSSPNSIPHVIAILNISENGTMTIVDSLNPNRKTENLDEFVSKYYPDPIHYYPMYAFSPQKCEFMSNNGDWEDVYWFLENKDSGYSLYISKSNGAQHHEEKCISLSEKE